MLNKYKPSKYNIEIDSINEHKLIYNTLSQVFSLLEEDDIRFYKKALLKAQGELNPEEETILDHFLINNFLVPDDVDETTVFEKIYESSRNSNENMSLTVLPTLNCNFGCDYCFQGGDKPKEVMPQSVQNSVFKFIKQNSEHLKRINITWFGGEPMLGFNVIKRISDRVIPYADIRGIYYESMIVTNGYYLTVEKLAELYLRRVKMIQITLDGSLEQHNKLRYVKATGEGSFETIIKNIKNYIDEFPINTTIRVNIDKRNKNDIINLINNLSEAGLGNKRLSLYFAPIECSTSACRNISDITLEQQEFAEIEYNLYQLAYSKGLCQASLPYRMVGLCGATKPKGLVIVPNGDIHKCWETVSFPDKRIGTIKNEDFVSKDLVEKWESWNPFKYEECRNCVILPNCCGFCAYKFLYKSEFGGNSTAKPCPSLKYNIKEKLLHLAEQKKMLAI